MVVSGKDLDEHRRPDLQAGWTATWLWTDGRRHRCVASRPCPDCHGTGEQWAEVGRLVLDAARADVEWRYAMTPGERDRLVGAGWSAGKWTWVGEVKIWPMSRRCEARPPLHVQATRWQDLGDPLGEWLALFLAGRDEWEQEASARA